jgi:protease I
MPLPAVGYEATEAGVPWKVLHDLGARITFATPNGAVSKPDTLTATGKGGGWRGLLFKADKPALKAWREMEASPEYQAPLCYEEISCDDFDVLVLPGGHHHGMREYLGSEILQRRVADFFAARKLVAAICHGVLLAARSRRADGRSVLHGCRTTIVPTATENMVFRLCAKKFGNDYGKPYKLTAEEEVRSLLASPEDLVVAAPPLRKDAPGRTDNSLCMVDGDYISARMPHDAWGFAALVEKEVRTRFSAMLRAAS